MKHKGHYGYYSGNSKFSHAHTKVTSSNYDATKKDDEAIEKGLRLGGHVGMRFLPIWLQVLQVH